MRIPVRTAHPFETAQFLVIVGLVVILIFLIFLFLFFRLSILCSVIATSFPRATGFPAALSRLLASIRSFLALAGLGLDLLRRPVAPNIGHCLHFALLGQLLRRLLLLLLLILIFLFFASAPHIICLKL